MKKFILLLCILAPIAAQGMFEWPNIQLPDTFIQAVRNAHTVADSTAAITRAKSKMAKIAWAGFIVSGIGAGAYLGLKVLSNQNMINRCGTALYAALVLGVVGGFWGAKLISWLWYRRTLNQKKALSQTAAGQWATQQTNFLQSIRNYPQIISVDEIRNTITNSITTSHIQLNLARYNHDQHYVDAMSDIIDKAHDMVPPPDMPALQQLHSHMSGFWAGFILSHPLTHL